MRGTEPRAEPTPTPREAFLIALRGYLDSVQAPPDAEGRVLGWLAEGARRDPGLSQVEAKLLLELAKGR